MEAHAPEQKRDPERKQEVGQDSANERSAHHVEQAGLKRDHGDNELGRVAECRVQQPADSITGPGRNLLRGVDKQARNWNDRERSGEEHERRRDAPNVLEPDRDRHKRKQPVQ